MEMAGQTISCPHCQLETLLFIPQVAAPPKLKSEKTSFIPVIVGVVVLVGVILVGFAVFNSTKKQDKSAAATSDQNLQEVKGGMGWNLGDVLPSNLPAKNNDDGFGITYDFDPPADMEKADIVMSYLILTEERKIAAICVTERENDHFNKEALQNILTEKYGLRKSLNFGTLGTSYYFGQTNRQVVLTATSQNPLIDLEYRDEQLYNLAKQQQAIRVAAAKKQIQNDLKGHF